MKTIYITRFRKKYPVRVDALYKKGKKGKLSTDNIRLLVADPTSWHNIHELHKTSHALMMPDGMEFVGNTAMANGTCAVSGIRMSERPEFIGDLGYVTHVEIENGGAYPEKIRSKGYNYYLQDFDDAALDLLINAYPCLSYT